MQLQQEQSSGLDGSKPLLDAGPTPEVDPTTATGVISPLPLYQLGVAVHLAITIITIFVVFNSPRVGC
jgi:hypothetical protein